MGPMLGLVIGIFLGCLLFIPAVTDFFNIDLPPWVPALAGLGFPLFFIISFIKQRQKDKTENPKNKMSADEKKAFRDIESGPGRGPNIKF